MKQLWFLLLAPLLSCQNSPPSSDGLVMLQPREQLIRLSIDLRGVHPTEDELVAFEQNPTTWNTWVETWLQDPRLVDRLLEIYNQRYLTRNGQTYFNAEDAGLDGVDAQILADVVGEEPLALLRYVIEHELPYSHMVTADHTMATPLLAAFWDTDYPNDADGWQRVQYQDGRPHAGILTMTTTWQRYPSMGGNANRHRANAVSKILLCEDYLTRPIVLNRAAVDQLTLDPEAAIADNPGCQSCHASLDPLSANFFGFFNYDDDMGIGQTVYRPENEQAWADYSGKPPGFFGRPTANIQELALEIVEDPRFASCAVQTLVDGLTQRSTDATTDWTELQQHILAFEHSNQNLLALTRSIVNDPSYRVAFHADDSTDSALAGLKMVSPTQLASIMEDLTGYRWTFGGRDGMTTHDLGLPVLAGGIDSDLVTTPSHNPSVGMVFIQERLAQAAAWNVANEDLATDRQDSARLLKFVNIEDTPESNPDAFEAQIRHLYLAITGVPLPPEAPEPAALTVLWKQVYSVDASSTAAWASVTSVVLRDPRVLLY